MFLLKNFVRQSGTADFVKSLRGWSRDAASHRDQEQTVGVLMICLEGCTSEIAEQRVFGRWDRSNSGGLKGFFSVGAGLAS